MIRLVAISPEDGWAFVQEDGNYFQVRPPYHRHWKIPFTELEVARLIGADGFEAADREFPNWGDLIAFFRAEIKRTRSGDVSDEAQQREMFRFLDDASDDVLAGFLDRVENEYLSKGRYELARSAIKSMQKSERLWTVPAISKRAADLLEDADRLNGRGAAEQEP